MVGWDEIFSFAHLKSSMNAFLYHSCLYALNFSSYKFLSLNMSAVRFFFIHIAFLNVVQRNNEFTLFTFAVILIIFCESQESRKGVQSVGLGIFTSLNELPKYTIAVKLSCMNVKGCNDPAARNYNAWMPGCKHV